MADTPFLAEARRWLDGDDPPDTCAACGFAWTGGADEALRLVAGGPERASALLGGRDGTVRPEDGSWNASAYLYHLADLARGWSERWVQLRADPGSVLVPWDPDQLAEARNYVGMSTVAGLWSLSTATAALVALTEEVGPELAYAHGQWGRGTVGDAVRWLAHEYHHHLHDIDQRAG
jgi:hypothetical protein